MATKKHETEAPQKIRYYIHNGSPFIYPHYAGATDLKQLIDEAREDAVAAIKRTGAARAIYAVQHYEEKTDTLREVDIYLPAVALNDADFHKRTGALTEKYHGCICIQAIHAHA